MTEPIRIAPFDPHGYRRDLHYVQDDSNGQRKPERKSFYEAIARTLKDATQILLMGSGTGSASAMEQLVADLEKCHPDLARRVVGTVTLDTQHQSEDQLLARARAFYERPLMAPNAKGSSNASHGLDHGRPVATLTKSETLAK